jgi:hypothetical protein
MAGGMHGVSRCASRQRRPASFVWRRSPPTGGRRNSRRGQRILRGPGFLPLRSAYRPTHVHAQGKISAVGFFCGNFLATLCHLMLRRHAYVRGTRCEAMRRKGSAAAIAPQKNLILPQDKSHNTRCLQFAARLVGRVNVRDLVNRSSSVSTDTTFRAERRASKPQDAADCHRFAATCPVLAARNRVRARQFAMRLKRFNQRGFSSRSDRSILILPQAAQLHLT